MGDYLKAEKYFREALELIDQTVAAQGEEASGETTNRGGVLLGLGLIQDRDVL